MNAEVAALIAAAQRGDRGAFGRLFEAFAPMVHGVLLARVAGSSGSADVDDLMQDVFVTAMQQLPALREPMAFGAWLATIARNRAVDFHRAHRKTTHLSDDLDSVDVASPNLVTKGDGAMSEAEQVLLAIRSLPEAYREPLILRLVEGMTGPEIAEQVGMTSESVRVNLHRGMKHLRAKLGTAAEPAPPGEHP